MRSTAVMELLTNLAMGSAVGFWLAETYSSGSSSIQPPMFFLGLGALYALQAILIQLKNNGIK